MSYEFIYDEIILLIERER